MKHAIFAACLLVAASGCDRRATTTSRSELFPDAGAQAVGDAASDAAAVGAEFEQKPFSELVRAGRLADADKLVAALSPEERAKPPLRFLQAYLALALGRADEALTSSESLDKDLPLLVDRITVLRAEAFWRAGRAEEAGDLFARLGPSYALRAAEAYARAGNAERVRKSAANGLDPKTKKRAGEASARRLRLRFEDDRQALEDARWLATVGAAEAGAEEGMHFLREKKATLSPSELEARGKAFAEAGMIAEARSVATEIERGGKAEHRTLACFVRATALFHSRAHYKEAERAFSNCEKIAIQPEEKAESAFLAARALLRANDDDGSIVLFERVLDRYPKWAKASEARSLIARTHFLQGRFSKAHELYEQFAVAMKGSEAAEDFAHYRPFAALYGGNKAKAKTLFEERMSHRDSNEARFSALFSAVAAEQTGDLTTAKSRLRNLYEKSPWSAPGLYARARLVKLGEAVELHYEAGLPSVAPVNVVLPDGVTLLHALGLDSEAEAYLEPREAVVMQAAHGRETEALCSAYGLLGRARRPYRMTSRMPQHYLDHKPTGSARWVWSCMFPEPYAAVVDAEAKAHGVPAELIYAVMRTESGYDPEAASPVGARGLMQLMPATAKRLLAASAHVPPIVDQKGAVFTEPAKNIELGARHLAEIHAAEGSWPLAVMGYNGSPEAVARWRKRLPELPLDAFAATIPILETRKYVVKVIEAWARYQVLRAPDSIPALDLELPAAR